MHLNFLWYAEFIAAETSEYAYITSLTTKQRGKIQYQSTIINIKVLLFSETQALLAQWIARWTSNPKVVGSSPTQGILYEISQFYSPI